MIHQLLKNPLFKGVNYIELDRLLWDVKYKTLKFSKGETIAFRGDEIEGLYVLLEGLCITEMMKSNGEIRRIETLEENQMIASAFVFGKVKEFPVDLISEEETKLFYIEKDELVKMMSKNSKIMINFVNEVSSKAQFLTKKIWSNVNNKTIVEKLASYIEKNQEKTLIQFKPSMKELANYFNVTRPSLSRVVADFVTEGILEQTGKRNCYKIISKSKLKKKISV